MYKVLNPRDNVDSQYVSKKKRKNSLASIEDSVDASIQRLEENYKIYTEKRGGRLITATRSNTDDTRISRTTIIRKQIWKKNNFTDALSD